MMRKLPASPGTLGQLQPADPVDVARSCRRSPGCRRRARRRRARTSRRARSRSAERRRARAGGSAPRSRNRNETPSKSTCRYPARMEVGPILAALPAGAAGRGRARREHVPWWPAAPRRSSGATAPTPSTGAGPAGPRLVGRVRRLRPRPQHRAGPAPPASLVRPGLLPDVCFLRFGAHAELDRRTGECRVVGRGAARTVLERARQGRAPVRSRARSGPGSVHGPRASTGPRSRPASARSSTSSRPATATR